MVTVNGTENMKVIPIRPGGVLFAQPSSQSIVDLLWMGISISIPDGFSSLRYLHCLLKSKKFFITNFFRNLNFSDILLSVLYFFF